MQVKKKNKCVIGSWCFWILCIGIIFISSEVFGSGIYVKDDQVQITVGSTTKTATVDQDGYVDCNSSDSYNALCQFPDPYDVDTLKLQLTIGKDSVPEGNYTLTLGLALMDHPNTGKNRKLEAVLPGVKLEVSSGSMSVTIPENSKLYLAGALSDGTTKALTTMENSQQNGPVAASCSGDNCTLTFDATGLRDKIKEKFNNDPDLNDLLRNGTYQYQIFVGLSGIELTLEGNNPISSNDIAPCGSNKKKIDEWISGIDEPLPKYLFNRVYEFKGVLNINSSDYSYNSSVGVLFSDAEECVGEISVGDASVNIPSDATVEFIDLSELGFGNLPPFISGPVVKVTSGTVTSSVEGEGKAMGAGSSFVAVSGSYNGNTFAGSSYEAQISPDRISVTSGSVTLFTTDGYKIISAGQTWPEAEGGGSSGGGGVTPPLPSPDEQIAQEAADELVDNLANVETPEELINVVTESLDNLQEAEDIGVAISDFVEESMDDIISTAQELGDVGVVSDVAEELVTTLINELSGSEAEEAVEKLGASMAEGILKSLPSEGEASSEEVQNVVKTISASITGGVEAAEEVGHKEAMVKSAMSTVLESDALDTEAKGTAAKTVVEDLLSSLEGTTEKAEVVDEVVAEVLKTGAHEVIDQVVEPVVEDNLKLDITDELKTQEEVAGETIEVVDPAPVAPVIENGVENIGLDVEVEPAGIVNVVKFQEAEMAAPVVVIKAEVDPQEEVGIKPEAGGLLLKVVNENHLVTVVAPLVPDVEGLMEVFGLGGQMAGLSGGNFASTTFKGLDLNEETGILTIETEDGSKYEGYFGWVAEGGNELDKIDTEEPFVLRGEDNSASKDFRVGLKYQNGAIQDISPAISNSKELLDWLKASNLDVNIDRTTGVWTITGSNGSTCVKADYQISPFNSQEEEEFSENKNQYGFYLKKIEDINGDGLIDVELWTSEGKQMVWGVSCN